MSATVDSLNIKIDASARGANQQLDKLVQKMVQLRSSVNGISVGNLDTLSNSIKNFSRAASGLNQVKTSDFTRLAKNIEKLSNIRKSELNRAATAITNISKAFSNIGNISDGADKIGQLAQSISRLGYKSTTQAIQNIPLLTTALKDMMTELSKVPKVSDNIIAMTNAMANLGAQAGNIRSLGSAMNSAGKSGNGFFGTIKKGVSGIKNFATNLRSATGHSRSLASTIGLLYAKFWTLKRAVGGLGSAIESSMNYIEEYNYFNTTMEKIASEWSDDFKQYGYENADVYGKSFESRVTEIMNKMTGFQMNTDGTLTDSGIKNLGLDVTQMTNYAAGVAQVTNSVGLTGEASVAASKALSMLAGDMSSFRNLDMSTVMNNFSSGLIGQSRALYKYGIDITNATLATYAHELGINKDISAMTQSEKMQLRMIAILDQSKVAWGDLAKTINSPANQLRLLNNNFKALARTVGNIFLPVVAKVLPYINGLVIAIRRLFEWTASMLGIKLDDVIGNSGGGYSNAFDGLEDDADNASSAIDGVADSTDKATEAQKKLNKQLQGFDKLNNMTTTTTGGNSSSGDKGSGSGGGAPIDLTSQLNSALADYEKVWNEAYENMTNDAEKFANKLTTLFKKAWTTGDGSDIGSAIAKWLNKGIKWVNDNWSIADDKIQKIAGILATAINGFTYEFDWSGLGTALSKTLQTYLDGKTTFFDKVDWAALGRGIATSLNSFIGDGGTGPIQSYLKMLGSKLRAAIEFAFGAVTTFKFDNLGKAIGQGINDFLDKMGKVNPKTNKNGWQELATTISEGIQGVATTITTALKTVKWEDVGQAIADFIKDIEWGKIVWKLGDMATSLFSAIVDAVSTIVEKAPLESAIVGLFATLKLTGIDKNISTAIQVALMNKNLSLGKIVLGLSLAAVTFKLADSEDVVKSVIMAPITAFMASKVFGVSTKISLEIAGVTLAATGSFSLGQLIGEALQDAMASEDMSEYRYNFKFSDLFSYSLSEWKQGFKDWWNDIDPVGTIKELAKDIKNGDFKPTLPFGIELPSSKEAIEMVEKWVSKTFKNAVAGSLLFAMKISTTIEEAKEKVKEWISKTFSKGVAGAINLAVKVSQFADKKSKEVMKWWKGIKQKTKNLKVNAKGYVDKTWKSVKKAWGNFREGAKTVWAKAKGKADDTFKSIGKSWGSFKKTTKDLVARAVGKTEDTWDSVQEAWGNFKEGTKNLFVSADGAIQDGFKDVSSKWSDFKGGTKNALINAKGDIKKGFNDACDKWKKFSKNAKKNIKNATLKLLGNQNSPSYKKVKKMYDSFHSKTATLSAKAVEKTKNAFKKVKATWKAIKTKSAKLTATFVDNFTAPIKKAWNGIARLINKAINTINKIPGVNITKRLPMLAKGGIYSGGTWHNIAKYAGGGLPGMGQMFVAREAGPELVGTIGGHTAVMNNNQIVASVSDGVFNALNPVLTSLVNAINTMASASSNGNGDVYVQIDGDNIARAVRRSNSDYRKRTGKGMFD